MTIILATLAVVMVIIGLIGVVMPALPGHMLILAGLIVGAWAMDSCASVSGRSSCSV